MTKLAIKRRLSLKRNIGLGAVLPSAGGSPAPTIAFPATYAKYDADYVNAQYFNCTQPPNNNLDDGRIWRSQISQYLPTLSEAADGRLIRNASDTCRLTSKGLWVEAVGDINPALWNRDLTNAVWTKAGATVLLNQTGRDGVANLASQVTATANGATVSQALTSARTTNGLYIDLKPISGSNYVDVSLDGGTTFTTITMNTPRYNGWGRYNLPVAATATNPTLVIRLPFAGDVVGIDLVQVTAIGWEDNPNIQTTTALIRQRDRPSTAIVTNGTVAQSHGSGFMDYMYNNDVWGVYLEWFDRYKGGGGLLGVNLQLDANSKGTFQTLVTGNPYVPNAVNKILGFANNGIGKVCLNGGAVVTGSGAEFLRYQALDHIDLASNGAGVLNGSRAVRRVIMLKTAPTDAQMQAWTALT